MSWSSQQIGKTVCAMSETENVEKHTEGGPDNPNDL